MKYFKRLIGLFILFIYICVESIACVLDAFIYLVYFVLHSLAEKAKFLLQIQTHYIHYDRYWDYEE